MEGLKTVGYILCINLICIGSVHSLSVPGFLDRGWGCTGRYPMSETPLRKVEVFRSSSYNTNVPFTRKERGEHNIDVSSRKFIGESKYGRLSSPTFVQCYDVDYRRLYFRYKGLGDPGPAPEFSLSLYE